MAKHKLSFDDSYNLDHQMKMLSMEANVLSNTIDLFKNIIPSVSNKIQDIVDSFVYKDNSKLYKNIDKNYEDISKKINMVSYSNYEKNLVIIPEGFKGTYLNYTNVLNELTPELYKTINEVLLDYKTILSTFISNKDFKITSSAHNSLYKKIAKDREEMVKKITVFFPKKSTTSRTKLGEVLERLSDLETITKNIKFLDKLNNKTNLKNISDNVNECCELLDIVSQRLDDNSISKISGQASLNISEGAYEVAQLVELMSVFKFRNEQLIESYDKFITQLNKNMR